MRAKEHYDKHLGHFYSWMAGDFETGQKAQQRFLEEQSIFPKASTAALDLGAGHGLQSCSLAKLGFQVTAIDFNQQLLNELRYNCNGLSVTAVEDDIVSVKSYKHLQPELITCWGDTLTHLQSRQQIRQFIEDCCDTLSPGGKLLLSFRDYSQELIGINRFIPVKSDERRILTCFLEYFEEYVHVTDLLHEQTEQGWQQRASTYQKVRVLQQDIVDLLKELKMSIEFHEPVNRMITLIAVKGSSL